MPGLLKKLYPSLTWDVKGEKEGVYLTFDDGPTPEVTTYVLDLLEAYQAEATFFCIGKNISAHPQLFREIKERGHSIGNHTYNHLNASKSDLKTYIREVQQTREVMAKTSTQETNTTPPLFRPPYGRIKRNIIRELQKENYRIVMWSLISGDFDRELNTEESLHELKKHTRPGSVIVFHDSVKAYENLKVILPEYLEFLRMKGLEMKRF